MPTMLPASYLRSCDVDTSPRGLETQTGISSSALVSENTNSLQKKLWNSMCDLAGDSAWETEVDFMFMPVFHAVMKQTLSGYQEIASLSCRDDTNFASPILNFRHIALAYQQYSDNPHLLAEDQHERSCRLRACTKIIGTVISNVMSELEGDMLTVPPDLLDWCQRAANSNPSGVSAFCTEWAHTLQIANHTHAGSHNPFESPPHLPASVEAMCNLLEEVVTLIPVLIQGSENICRLSLIINRAAAQVQKDKMDLDCKSGPVSVPSALDMTDSDDEL